VAPGRPFGLAEREPPAPARAAGPLSSVARETPPPSPVRRLRPETGHSSIDCSETSITKATTAAAIVAVPETAPTT
jgi:hypothetical protein